MKWEDDILYFGKFPVGKVCYDGVTSGADKYFCLCYLPGIKARLTKNCSNIPTAKIKLEKVAQYWLNRCGLEAKP